MAGVLLEKIIWGLNDCALKWLQHCLSDLPPTSGAWIQVAYQKGFRVPYQSKVQGGDLWMVSADTQENVDRQTSHQQSQRSISVSKPHALN